MKKSIANRDTTKHEFIREHIRKSISSGRYTNKLPGERVLAEKFGVSFLTVRRAMEELVESGLIERISGKGSFVRKERKLSNTIGFLWTGGVKPSFSMTGELLVKGAIQALRPLGIDMLIDYLDEKDNSGIPIRDKIDGLLIHGPKPDSETVKILNKIPSVWIFHTGAGTWCDRVQPNHRLVGRKAVEYFREQNCRRICCITSKPTYPDNSAWTERANSFEQFANLAEIPCCMLGSDFERMLNADKEAETVEKVMKEFLSLSPRPDGLFVANMHGYRYYEALNRAGLVIGRALQMVIGDYDMQTMDLPPGPVTVDIHPREIGRTAVNQLLWRIENPDAPLVEIQTEPTLLIK